jgi:hypothetical protein
MPINTDIVIVGDDGKTYKVPTDTWMKPENKIPADFAGDAGVVVKRGALLAEVPMPEFPVGYYCILINFSEVEGAPSAPAQSADAGDDTDLGTEGLIIHIERDAVDEAQGAFYVVTEKTWQALEVDPASVPTSTDLAENGALCATTNEGFLVNLDRIGAAGG